MWVKREINTFDSLKDECWSGARERLEHVSNLGIEDEFMDYISDWFNESEERPIDLTDLNDFIWFSGDDIIERICLSKGITTDGDPIEDDDEDADEFEDEDE